MLMDTRVLREGRGQFDKLFAKDKPLSYKGQGTEVNSGDKKNGKNCRLNIVETKFKNILAEVQNAQKN